MAEPAEAATIPMDKLAKAYRRIRDQKLELTAKYDADVAVLDEKLETLVHAMRDQMKAAGVTSVRVTRPSLEEVYLGMVGDRGMGI